MPPTYRRCRLIKNVDHLIRRVLKIEPQFAVIKEVTSDELNTDFREAFLRILREEREEGVAPDITLTRNLTMTINGKTDTWNLMGFCRSGDVYISNVYDPTVIYKAD
jgi:hypothetical protein